MMSHEEMMGVVATEATEQIKASEEKAKFVQLCADYDQACFDRNTWKAKCEIAEKEIAQHKATIEKIGETWMRAGEKMDLERDGLKAMLKDALPFLEGILGCGDEGWFDDGKVSTLAERIKKLP